MPTHIRTQIAVPKATEDTSIAQWGQVKDLVNKFNKETVRVATTSEIMCDNVFGELEIQGVLTTIDGVTLNDGDRILQKDQLDSTENGIYIINIASCKLTRSDDFADGSIIMNNTSVTVAEGDANADTKWKVVSDGVLTVGTSNIIFTKDSGECGLKRAHGMFVGDGATKEFTVAHNFNLTSVNAYSIIVKSVDSATSDGVKDNVVAHAPTTSAEANSVTIKFDTAPPATETFDVYLECLE